ncbi:MAG: DEAD/DEAH box helicase [Roseivirga sp.]
MSTETIISARSHPTFVSVFNDLVVNRFYIEIERPELCSQVNSEALDKAIWLATIIATSDDEDDKYLASVFAIALFLESEGDLDLQQASFVILSRSGNLIASKFFKELIIYDDQNTSPQFTRSFGAALDLELGTKMALNQFLIRDSYITFSDYQRQLWKALQNGTENIAISAPTSAGKSFIIQSHLIEKFVEEEEYKVIYVVPTRALIAQVSETLKRSLPDDVKVSTAFIENVEEEGEQFEAKEIFVLTPERCLKLLQYAYKSPFSPDLLFLDEIQNIENIDGRGFLLEFLLNEITSIWAQTRIIIAGPFLERPESLFRMIFNRDSNELQTLFSPVFQLKVRIKPSMNDRSINAQIYFQQEIIRTLELDVGFDFKSSIRNKSRTLIQLVTVFGKASKNIIYFPRTDYAEKYAVNLADLINGNNPNNPQLGQPINDLIELIAEEIHPSYYLIDALRANTAFHHGKLPEIIRGELEYLFSSGTLQNIVCTSTLMEGVNLPAQKIFIAHPKKDTIPLSNLEFGNIVGRAGRIKDSLTGTVLCVENDNENWAEENLTNSPSEEIKPAINKVLSTPIPELVDAITRPIDDVPKELNSAVSFLKHKFLQGDQILDDYLLSKGLEDEVERNRIIEPLRDRLIDLTIPAELTRLNPSIDPEIQNELFNSIRNEGIEEWVIFENNRLFARINKEQRLQLTRREDNLYGQFETLVLKLDEIVDLNSEAFFKHRISRSVKQMVLYATKWMRDASMSQLIREEINFYANIHSEKLDITNRDKVNRKINEVIKIYSTIVSFVLVKYLKLLSDILQFLMTDEQKEQYKLTLSLPTYLELGTLHVSVLQLISQGMSRSVAIKVGPLVPEEWKEKASLWLKEQENINLAPVYVRYLKRKGFMKVEEVDNEQ